MGFGGRLDNCICLCIFEGVLVGICTSCGCIEGSRIFGLFGYLQLFATHHSSRTRIFDIASKSFYENHTLLHLALDYHLRLGAILWRALGVEIGGR